MVHVMRSRWSCTAIAVLLLLGMTGCGNQNAPESSVSPLSSGTSSAFMLAESSSPGNETASSDHRSTAGDPDPTFSSKGSDNSRESFLSSGDSNPDGREAFSHRPSRPSSTEGSGGETHSSSFPPSFNPPSSSENSGSPQAIPSSTVPSSSSPPPTPSESSETVPSSSAPPPESDIPDDLKSYVYPFDIDAIRADLIRYGESLGMAHRPAHPDGTLRTPDNCSWWNPYLLSPNSKNPTLVRRQLYEMVEYDKNKWGLQDFAIYVEGSSGQYLVYMLH